MPLSIYNCHPNVICINTPDSFDCQCDDGFDGDGIDCVVPNLINALFTDEFINDGECVAKNINVTLDSCGYGGQCVENRNSYYCYYYHSYFGINYYYCYYQKYDYCSTCDMGYDGNYCEIQIRDCSVLNQDKKCSMDDENCTCVDCVDDYYIYLLYGTDGTRVVHLITFSSWSNNRCSVCNDGYLCEDNIAPMKCVDNTSTYCIGLSCSSGFATECYKYI
eukprot:Pgem_evm1s11201